MQKPVVIILRTLCGCESEPFVISEFLPVYRKPIFSRPLPSVIPIPPGTVRVSYRSFEYTAPNHLGQLVYTEISE